MKSEKGITLTTLLVYIVIMLIALITLGTITAYFQSNIKEFNTKSTQDIEFDKFNLYFIKDIKTTNNVLDILNSTETIIVFKNGNKYEFKDNSIIFNDNVKIAEKIDDCMFDWSIENEKQTVIVYMKIGESERTNEYVLSNQTVGSKDNQDYVYGYKRVEGTNLLTLDDSIKTNLKNYIIEGNSVQKGTPTSNVSAQIQSVGDKTKNLIDYTQAVPRTSKETVTIIEDGVNFIGTYYFKIPVELSPETYTFSAVVEGTNRNQWRYLYKDGSYGPYASSGASAQATQDVQAIMVYVAETTTINCTVKNIQLELGSTRTEYEPYGKYKISIITKGKNLFDGEMKKGAYAASNGRYQSSSTRHICSLNPIYVESEKSYSVFRINSNVGSLNTVMFYDEDNNYLGYSSITNKKLFKTLPNTKYIYFNVAHNDASGTMSPDEAGDIQIEEGFIITPVNTNIFLDEPLRKIDEYKDYIDFENQEISRSVKQIVINGTEDWKLSSEYSNTYYIPVTKTIKTGISNCYESMTYSTQLGVKNGIYLLTTDYIYITDNRYSTVESFKEMLAQKYQNKEPVIINVVNCESDLTTIITEKTKITLTNIPTVENATVLSIETEVEPTYTQVVYYSN